MEVIPNRVINESLCHFWLTSSLVLENNIIIPSEHNHKLLNLMSKITLPNIKKTKHSSTFRLVPSLHGEVWIHQWMMNSERLEERVYLVRPNLASTASHRERI